MNDKASRTTQGPKRVFYPSLEPEYADTRPEAIGDCQHREPLSKERPRKLDSHAKGSLLVSQVSDGCEYAASEALGGSVLARISPKSPVVVENVCSQRDRLPNLETNQGKSRSPG